MDVGAGGVHVSMFSIVLHELELVLYFFLKLHALDGCVSRAR